MKVYLVYECFKRLSQDSVYCLIIGSFTDKELAETVCKAINNDIYNHRSAIIKETELSFDAKKLVFCEITSYNRECPVMVEGQYQPFCSYNILINDTPVFFFSIDEAKKSGLWLDAVATIENPTYPSENSFGIIEEEHYIEDEDGHYRLELVKLLINKETVEDVGEDWIPLLDLNEVPCQNDGCKYSKEGVLLF